MNNIPANYETPHYLLPESEINKGAPEPFNVAKNPTGNNQIQKPSCLRFRKLFILSSIVNLIFLIIIILLAIKKNDSSHSSSYYNYYHEYKDIKDKFDKLEKDYNIVLSKLNNTYNTIINFDFDYDWIKYFRNDVKLFNDENNGDYLLLINGKLVESKTVHNWDTLETNSINHISIKFRENNYSLENLFKNIASVIKVDFSSFNSAPKSLKGLFNGCKDIKDIIFGDLDTSQVTDMSEMFRNLYSLTSLDISKFNTSKVIDMSGMFQMASSLTSLDIINLNTASVTNMSYMFSSMKSLGKLNLKNFDTSSVKDMSYMFSGSNPNLLQLNNLNTSSVITMKGMFSDMINLIRLDINNFDTSFVTDMSHLFDNCQSLSSINITNFNTSNVEDMSYMFSMCNIKSSEYQLDISSLNTTKVKNMSHMFSRSKDVYYSLSLDIRNFDTSNVEDMSYMFQNVRFAYKGLVINIFNTSNVRYMSHMFDSMYLLNLFEKNYFDDIDTSNAVDMSYMFYNSNIVWKLGNKFSTSKAKNMSYMFGNFQKSCSIDFTKFDTSNVEDMSGMFYNSYFSFSDLSFDTSKVKDMSKMFAGMGQLTKLTLTFNLSSIENMKEIFGTADNHYIPIKELDISKLKIPESANTDKFFDGISCNKALIIHYSAELINKVQNQFCSNWVQIEE